MLCNKCSTQLPDWANYCFKCGTPQRDRRLVCSRCGTDLPPGARFCCKCGQQQEQAAPKESAVPEFEYCKLLFVDKLFGIFYEARTDHSTIAKSDTGIRDRREANANIVAKLQAEGWEPFETNRLGLVSRMRRKM